MGMFLEIFGDYMLVNCYQNITTGNPEFTPCVGGHEIQVVK